MPWPLTPAAAALLGRDHGVDVRLLASVNGSEFVVPVELVRGSGSVRIERSSAARRTLDCEVVARLDAPAIDPLGAELRAEYAIVDTTSRTRHWVPVGTFVVTEVVESGGGRCKITGVDRWQRVLDARFERPETTAGDTLAELTRLLEGADQRIRVDTTGALAGAHAAALWPDDRAEAITKLASSTGNEVYFDAMGVARVRAVAALSDAVAWHIGTGVGGVRVSARRGVGRSRTYNVAAVTGEPQGLPPVHAVARIATGPLRYGGPLGIKVRRFATPLVSTPEQAQAMANGLIARVSGVARTLDVVTLPNPAIDAGDVVTVETRPGAWQRHLVESMTLPLGLGATPIATRSDVDELTDA